MTQSKKIFFYMIFAYVFSLAFHLFWLSWASKYPEFYWHGQLMINNPDGYYFASDSQKILYGMHKYNFELSHPFEIGLGVITAFIVKFLPFLSLDIVILYLSAIVSSLIVIPIILIGKLYKNIEWGFLSALLASIAWSFYNRTLVGYYDTDMFSVLNITIVLYLFLESVKNRNITASFLSFLMILFNEWVYPSGNTIIFSIFILSVVYLFFTDKEFLYKFLIIVSVSFLSINIFIKLFLGIGFYYLIRFNKIKNEKIFSLIVFLISILFSHVSFSIISRIYAYATGQVSVEGLHFLNVMRTVREASHIPYYIIADRIVGSVLGLIISIIGYILLVKKYKEFIIALPLWGVGFFSFFGGLRFTVHAVPIAALSAVYLLFYLAQRYEKYKKIIIYGGFVFLIIPNITHIVGCCEKNKTVEKIENSYVFNKFGIKIKLKELYPLRSYPYLVPTVLNKSEVAVLDKLKHISNEKDYVLTWWDYGYPIWYYADVNTLIDGGKHLQDNFIVSKILTTSNQRLTYNLGKLSLKTFIKINESNKTAKPAAMALFVKNGKPVNVDEFLNKISYENFQSIKMDRDLYLLLPYRMFDILPTISEFSNRNLNTSEVYPPHFFYKARIFKRGGQIFIGRFPLDLKRGMIRVNNQFIPLKEIDLVGYDKNMKLFVKKQKFRDNGLNLVILQSYGSALLLDDYYYNSTFVQMFVFENYDKNLFEPVILNPVMKIYRFK